MKRITNEEIAAATGGMLSINYGKMTDLQLQADLKSVEDNREQIAQAVRSALFSCNVIDYIEPISDKAADWIIKLIKDEEE